MFFYQMYMQIFDNKKINITLTVKEFLYYFESGAD
jgi:hypothetical protein